jgi:hypothetical protein
MPGAGQTPGAKPELKRGDNDGLSKEQKKEAPEKSSHPQDEADDGDAV